MFTITRSILKILISSLTHDIQNAQVEKSDLSIVSQAPNRNLARSCDTEPTFGAVLLNICNRSDK